MTNISIWTVYDHPTDYPEYFVARRFDGLKPTGDIMLSLSLAELRVELVVRGLTCLTRSPTDDAKIVETWL